jgi:hypothetical protein
MRLPRRRSARSSNVASRDSGTEKELPSTLGDRPVLQRANIANFSMMKAMATVQIVQITLFARVDLSGTDPYNMSLSRRRAGTVRMPPRRRHHIRAHRRAAPATNASFASLRRFRRG